MAYKQLKLWFDEEMASNLANKIKVVDPLFSDSAFVKAVKEGVGPLELKDRIALIARLLFEYFNNNFELGISILIKILGPKNPAEEGMFKDYFWIMPIAKYVEDYGLQYYESSIHALEEITQRSTAEWAIRPFIQKYPKRTYKQMVKWSKSESFHLRRLSSEGGRPRLPWASKLQEHIDDPSALFPILDNLKDDPSKYVQKSVANCLNDILKDNPEIAKGIIEKWIPGAGIERKWIIRHALRNLRKKNDPWFLELSVSNPWLM